MLCTSSVYLAVPKYHLIRKVPYDQHIEAYYLLGLSNSFYTLFLLPSLTQLDLASKEAARKAQSVFTTIC